MKNPKIILLPDGLKVIDVPDENEVFSNCIDCKTVDCSGEKCYNEALEQAIKQGVLFSPDWDAFLQGYYSQGNLEQGKLYDIPEWYQVEIKEERVVVPDSCNGFVKYAILKPITKQEPEKETLFDLAMEAVEFGGKKQSNATPVIPEKHTCRIEDWGNGGRLVESTPVIEQKEDGFLRAKKAVIQFLRKQENKPYIANSKGSWTTHELADEIAMGSEVGNDMIEGMLILTADLILRDKETLPESKQLTPNVSLPMDFVMWYSGMNKQQILNAYQRFLAENDYSKAPQQ